jgi:hypothetical protein
MRIVTKEEAKEIITKTGRASRLRLMLERLEAGQILMVEKKDVKTKMTPFNTVYRLNYDYSSRHYQRSSIESGEGWLSSGRNKSARIPFRELNTHAEKLTLTSQSLKPAHEKILCHFPSCNLAENCKCFAHCRRRVIL